MGEDEPMKPQRTLALCIVSSSMTAWISTARSRAMRSWTCHLPNHRKRTSASLQTSYWQPTRGFALLSVPGLR